MTSCIGYVRVSTKRQADEGVSIEMQKARIEAYCVYKGYTLQSIITDDGISGSGKVERPGYETVKDLCNNPDSGVKAVVIYSLSRFTRSTTELLSFVNEYVLDKGIELHSVVEQLDTSSPTGRFMLKVMGAMNELEREQIVERTQAALDHKRAKGEKLGGYVPYGYNVTKAGVLIENALEQQRITLIKDFYYNYGLSFYEISKRLNKSNIPSKNGCEWTHKTVSRLIRRV